MKSKNLIMCAIVGLLVCNSCTQNRTSKNKQHVTREQLIAVNRMLVSRDSALIGAYVKKQNLDMQLFPTGLWMQIDSTGQGAMAQKGQIIELDYTLSLLDGTVCYQSSNLGRKRFLIGQGGVEIGLEEAVLHLRKGDRAVIIMPPHLAHGLLGDDNKIPSRAILRYDLTVADLANSQDK